MKFSGRAQKNEMFQRIEFTANLVFTNPDPEEEMTRLQKELDTKEQSKSTEEGDVETVDDADEELEEEKEVKKAVEKANAKKDDILDIDDLSDLDNI